SRGCAPRRRVQTSCVVGAPAPPVRRRTEAPARLPAISYTSRKRRGSFPGPMLVHRLTLHRLDALAGRSAIPGRVTTHQRGSRKYVEKDRQADGEVSGRQQHVRVSLTCVIDDHREEDRRELAWA